MSSIQKAKQALVTRGSLVPFMCHMQRRMLLDGLEGEEASGIAELVNRIAEIIKVMPVTYQQDGLGNNAVVYLHYFGGAANFYITEKDVDGGVSQAFGLANIYGDYKDAEYGYISITELVENNLELDLHFEPAEICHLGK